MKNKIIILLTSAVFTTLLITTMPLHASHDESVLQKITAKAIYYILPIETEENFEEDFEEDFLDVRSKEFYIVNDIIDNGTRTDLILKWGDEFNLPVLLIVSVIRAESNNDPNAISCVGARGLMQLMPATAIYIAKALGNYELAKEIRRNPNILNTNEDLNVQYGCLHLSDHYRTTRSWKSALHSYNAGFFAFQNGKRNYPYVNRVISFWEINDGDIR